MCGFIAQLVEQRTGNAEVTGSNPVETLIFFFFRLLLSNCLNWKIYCDDHSSLSIVCTKSRIQSRKSISTLSAGKMVGNDLSPHLTSPLACLGDLGGGTSSLVSSKVLGRFWMKGRTNYNAWPFRLGVRRWVYVPSLLIKSLITKTRKVLKLFIQRGITRRIPLPH